ncbi:MAG: hypothetical protein IJJ00_00170 [Erysipelotrichaceae bacterium]|nr:hypothetical protein [Erysipelotrichaceae bacterium]
MKTAALKENLKRDLISLGYELYDVTYSKKDKILQVLIDKKMDLKEIESLSKKVSKIMDLYDEDMDEYILDVGSVGIERPIRDREELKAAEGSYIYVKTKEEKIYGTLVSFDEDVLTLSVKDKNIAKEMSLNYEDIKNVRYAVEF